MKKIIIFSGLLFSSLVFSQVAIGKATLTKLADNVTDNPNISLEFGDGNKGLVLPWVTKDTNVTGAVAGTLVYDITDHKVKVKRAAAWRDLTTATDGAAVTTLQDGLTDQTSAKVIIGANANTDTTPGILILSDTNKAMILPKLASPHLNIKNPAAGMMAYDITTNQLATFNGTVWSFWQADPDLSSNGTAVVSAYSCSTASAGTLTAGTPVSGVTQTITATVATAGTYSISTTANGVTFSGSGTFAGTGAQNIVLTATGTPTAAGTNAFTLNTTPGCSFNRTTVAVTPLPGNITLSSVSPYFIASVLDQDYLPYTAPAGPATLVTSQAADGVNETKTLNVQGTLTNTGITIKIPYTVVTAAVNLPAYSQTITIPAAYTQDGISRDVTFSYPAGNRAVGSGTITATLKANALWNVKQLDLQNGVGNDALGFLLAQFTYATNNTTGTANFDVRAIAGIPDRNIGDASHVMLYLPVLGADGNTWLNNNLGADYSNTAKTSFNPAGQTTSYQDFKAYGSLFQWGRYSDGHELINWTSGSAGTPVNTTTGTLSTTDTPGNSKFITINSGTYDWRNPQKNGLWQGVSGINNPCPTGYRIPTNAEFAALKTAAGITTRVDAANSTLKSSVSAQRYNNGTLDLIGNGDGSYWTSTVSGVLSLYMTPVNTSTSNYRSYGYSVRCIKN